MNLKKTVKPLVCLGVFGSALSMVFIKSSISHPFVLLFYRFLFVSLIMFFFVFFRKKHEILPVLKRNFKDLFITAIFKSAAMILWVFAVNNTSMASAAILSNTHSIIIVTLSILLFKTKYDKRALLGVLITSIACVLLTASDAQISDAHLKGDLLAFATACFWAFYLIYANKLRKKMSNDLYMLFLYSISFAMIAAVTVISGQKIFDIDFKEIKLFLSLAVFCSILGQGLVDWGLLYVSPSFASLAFLLEPAYALILGFFVMKEIPSFRQIFISAILIFGIFLFDKYEYIEKKEEINYQLMD